MPSAGRKFSGNASVTSLLHPWVTTPPWQHEGAFFGYELRTGRVGLFDPQMLKRLGIINSAVILILAAKDHGKSTLAKSLTARLLGLQVGLDENGIPLEARARAHDRKRNSGHGEYKLLCDWLMSDNIELSTFGSLNIFDRLMNMSEFALVTVAIEVAEAVLERKLRDLEPLVIQVAMYKMVREIPSYSSPFSFEICAMHMTQEDIDAYYDNAATNSLAEYDAAILENSEYAQWLNLTRTRPSNVVMADLRDDAGIISACFGRLLRADYGPMFGGTRSLRNVQTASMSNIDWSGITGKPAGLLEYMMSTWDTAAMLDNDRLLIPNVEVRDEQASALKLLAPARARDESIRKARAFNRTDIMITQYPTDLTQVGEAGSEIRGLGQSINRGVGIRFFGKMTSDDDTMHEVTRLGVTDEDAWLTTMLPQGCWGVHIPDQRIRWWQHIVLPSEIPLIESNTANIEATTRRAATSFPFVQERLAELERLQEEPVLIGVG